MDKSELRKIIHEECVKAMREELREILVEAVETVESKGENNFTQVIPYQVRRGAGKPVPAVMNNPIQAILRETVLSSADRANIGQVGSVAASPFSNMGPVTEVPELTNSVLPPFPGLE